MQFGERIYKNLMAALTQQKTVIRNGDDQARYEALLACRHVLDLAIEQTERRLVQHPAAGGGYDAA